MGFCQTCFSISFCVVLIVGIILFSLSFKIVDINNYALKRNSYNKDIDEKTVFKSGRYYTGLTGEFIEYPSTWQYINFDEENGDSPPLTGIAADQTNIVLEISLVYRLKPEFLYKLYDNYPQRNHKKDMITTAKEEILDIIPQYKYTDFFQNRHQISDQMSRQINKKFKDIFFSELTLFLLREITLVNQEAQIKQNIVEQQQIKTKQKEIEIQALEGQLEVIVSDSQKEINKIIIEANTEAQKTYQDQVAKGDGELLAAEGKGYAKFKDVAVIGEAWDNPEIMEFINWQKSVTNAKMDLYFGVSENAFVEI